MHSECIAYYMDRQRATACMHYMGVRVVQREIHEIERAAAISECNLYRNMGGLGGRKLLRERLTHIGSMVLVLYCVRHYFDYFDMAAHRWLFQHAALSGDAISL